MSAQDNSRNRADSLSSVASRGRQKQAAGRRDFGGGRSFLATERLPGSSRQAPRRSRSPASHPGRRAGQRRRRAVLTGRCSRTLARGSNCRPGRSRRRGRSRQLPHLGACWRREAVLLLQDPLVAARVDELRKVAVDLRHMEAEAVLLLGAHGAVSHPAAAPWPRGIHTALGRGQATGRAIVIMPACHAHAAESKSEGEAKAERQGLQHGRKRSLANINRG